MVNAPCGGLEGRMNRERNVEVLRGGEDPIVPGISVGDSRDRERAHEGATAAIRDGALQLFGRRGGIAQRQVRDGDQPAAGVAAEIGDPPVVRAAIRRRQLGVHQFGFPQEPNRRVEDGLGQTLAIEELDPLLHVHGAEPGPAQ